MPGRLEQLGELLFETFPSSVDPVEVGDIGDEVFRSNFVIQSPKMLDRDQRHVAPAAVLVDHEALERIAERWALPPDRGPAYPDPTLIAAGGLDSTVGYAAAVDLVDHYPHASLAVVDAGHALPHEQPALLRALVTPVARTRRAVGFRTSPGSR